MKNKIIIANWKMALNLDETEDLALAILKGLEDTDLSNVEVVLCPSFPALPLVNEIIKNFELPISLGSQDVSWEERGAYTGEVSALMLQELGVKYAIIGHSERRINLKETDEMINKKIKMALACNLIPIVCVGETIEEKRVSNGENVVKRQILNAFNNVKLNDKSEIIVAYEPIWAISSNVDSHAVEPEDAELMHLVIKAELFETLGAKNAEDNIKIIYGGSVDSNNIKKFSEKGIQGFLIGGASLRANEFVNIIKSESIPYAHTH
jgi:triosephosphate isomerase (TIM)